MNSSQKDKALPVKTSKPNFVIFFVYFGNSCLISCQISLFVKAAHRERHFARNLHEFGVARSEELEVNQWIVHDIHWLISQSDRAKDIIHCFSISWLIVIIPVRKNIWRPVWFLLSSQPSMIMKNVKKLEENPRGEGGGDTGVEKAKVACEQGASLLGGKF